MIEIRQNKLYDCCYSENHRTVKTRRQQENEMDVKAAFEMRLRLAILRIFFIFFVFRIFFWREIRELTAMSEKFKSAEILIQWDNYQLPSHGMMEIKISSSFSPLSNSLSGSF